jgi:ABC-2 type transport system ATP-binding protein
MGYVPQDIVLNETLSAVDNLEFFGSVNGLSSKETKIKAMEVLELVGLKDRGKEAVKTFSGGMKRRINIGCALMHNPKFIIMDEPTVGVDPQSRNHIFEIIHKLKTQNITVLYSSHYMEEIEHLCDYIALIDKGSVLENGTIQAVLQKYSTPSIYVEGEQITEKMFTSLGKVFTKGSGFIVENKETLTLLEKISELLKEHQLEVTRLEIAKPNLEDIFLKLTGTSLRD